MCVNVNMHVLQRRAQAWMRAARRVPFMQQGHASKGSLAALLPMCTPATPTWLLYICPFICMRRRMVSSG